MQQYSKVDSSLRGSGVAGSISLSPELTVPFEVPGLAARSILLSLELIVPFEMPGVVVVSILLSPELSVLSACFCQT